MGENMYTPHTGPNGELLFYERIPRESAPM
jgi:hypothetical protein